jgi:hypothetical protein
MKDVYTRMIGECMIDAAALLHTSPVSPFERGKPTAEGTTKRIIKEKGITL